MAIKIKMKLNQPYCQLNGTVLDETAIAQPIEFSFDEAMSILQAGFGEQVEDAPDEVADTVAAVKAASIPTVSPTVPTVKATDKVGEK